MFGFLLCGYFVYAYGTTGVKTGKSILLTPDNCFLVVGSTMGKAMAMKLDMTASQRWAKSYYGGEFVSALAVDRGFLLIAGGDGRIGVIAVDQDGTVNWARSYACAQPSYLWWPSVGKKAWSLRVPLGQGIWVLEKVILLS